MRSTARLLALVVATLVPAGAARADVAPPDDYVDPCAAMKFEDTCERCTSPEFKSRSCHEGARASGRVERCHGWNYTMYCYKDGVPPAAPQPTPAQPTPPPQPTPAPPPAVTTPPAPPSTPAPAQQPPPPPAVAASSGCTLTDHPPPLGLVLLLAASRRRRPSAQQAC
ncbi:MAG: hypothetical protein JNL82_38200 [Myxococcales bacterium]|nr:hypothetical protein [Myxococcales bacterium]